MLSTAQFAVLPLGTPDLPDLSRPQPIESSPPSPRSPRLVPLAAVVLEFPALPKFISFRWVVPSFDATVNFGFKFPSAFYKMPLIDDCKGIYALVSMITLLFLMWPLFQLLQRDLLSQLKIKARDIDWHALPIQRGGRMERYYLKVNSNAVGRLLYSQFCAFWPGACTGAAAGLNVLVQIMTLAMSTRLVELTQLFKRTEYAQMMVDARMVSPTYAIPSKCGEEEGDFGLKKLDQMSESPATPPRMSLTLANPRVA